MDFQQLMKQASANQSYTLKKHEQKKKQQEEKNKKEEEKRKEGVRKASALLHDMKKTSEKREREYRGIVNSRAADYEKAVSRLAPATSSDHSKGNKIVPSNGRPHPPATATTSSKQTTSGSLGKKSVEFSQAGKGKTKSSITVSSTKSSAVTSSSKTPKPQPSSKPSVAGSKSSASSGAATSSKSTTSSSSASRGSCGVKPPVNFQDLMRLAEQKKRGPDLGLGRRGDVAATGPAKTDTGRSSDKGRPLEKTSGGRSRSGSPLGKLLLEKSNCRGRTKNGHGGGTGGGGGGGSQISSRLAQEMAVGDRSVVGSNLRELAQSRVVGRGGARGGVRGGRVVGSGRGGESSQRMPESALLMRERFRKELEASANRGKTVDDAKTTTKPSAKSNSFYASSHVELSKEGQPNFAKARTAPSGPYQSSWVSEMNEYVERLREGGGEGYREEEEEEEEEEDGLGDFVVDDEEGDDVSSAIREIFGYDRRRYRDEDDDDRMMESSFAQQQYEEMRSSRIGRQEDAEDMRRENERLARKRRKRGGMETSLPRGPKQTKLSFR